MKIWLDTAIIDEIREAVSWGVVDGVTTNPTLMYRAGVRDFKQHVIEICNIVPGPVSAEVISTDAEGMIREAEEILSWAPNVVVKIPTTVEGLKAMRVISSWPNGRINATLIFSANQALLAAKAGATFISPFIGRLDDINIDGMELIADIRTIYDNYGYQTQILAASIRSPNHMKEAALIGADVATAPPSVIRRMAAHPLTDKGLAAFLADWEKTGQKIV